MKALLYAVTTMTLLVAGHLSPAMADGRKAGAGNTLVVSDTTARTATTPPPVGHQTGNGALRLYELDPELQRLYDEATRRAGVPLSLIR
jgi:hypothetical protein